MDKKADLNGYKIGYDRMLMDKKGYNRRIKMDKMLDIHGYRIGYERISMEKK